jgi:hypothetical protein
MRKVLLALMLIASAPAPAAARAEREVGWTADRVFPAAVRFLRVNEKVAIVEKDAEAGYVIFELTDDGKAFRGALELVPLENEKLRLVIQIEDRPEYMEIGMLDRLETKLRDELGAPKPKPKPKPEKDPPAEG